MQDEYPALRSVAQGKGYIELKKEEEKRKTNPTTSVAGGAWGGKSLTVDRNVLVPQGGVLLFGPRAPQE